MALQSTDNLIVGRSGTNYRITYQELKDDIGAITPPAGVIDQPSVLAPQDGAGSGTQTYLRTDTITAVTGSGVTTCETSLIESVDETTQPDYTDSLTWTNGNQTSALGHIFDGTTDTYGSVWLSNAAGQPQFVFDPGDTKVTTMKTKFTYGYDGYREDTAGFTVSVKYADEASAMNVTGTVDPNDDTVGIYTMPKPDSEIESITTTGQIQNQSYSKYVHWYFIEFDGQVLVSDATTAVLTFPDTQGFECFSVGDYAQGGVTTDLTEANYDIIFGGNAPSMNYAEVATFKVDFDGDVGFSGATQMVSNLSGVNGTINVYGKDKSTVLYTSPIQSLTGTDTLGVNFEDIGRIEWSADYAASMSYFTANGVYVNPTLQPPAKITAKSVPNKTITTDGGDWAGSEGPTQTRTVMYTTTAIPSVPAAGTYFRSNKSKAEGGKYDFNAVDKWYVQEAGVLELAFYNNAVNGNSPATFTFSTDDGVQCSEGLTWTMNSADLKNITFTFPNGGNFSISYYIADATPDDNHILYYLNYGGATNISKWTPTSTGVEMILDTNSNTQIVEGSTGDTKLTRSTPYNNKLTLSGSTALSGMTGSVLMTDGTTNSNGSYKQSPYKLRTTDIINVADAGGVEGADPAGLTVYYGTLTTKCKNYPSGTMTDKTFVVPSDPKNAFNGNNVGSNRAQAVDNNGIDIIIPAGIGDLVNGASVYYTTANGIMIAINGDFENAVPYNTYPETSGWFDITSSPAFQRDKKLYRFTIYRSDGTTGSIGVVGISGTTDGTSAVFTSSNYGTATGWLAPGTNYSLTFEDNNTDLQYFENGDVISVGTDDQIVKSYITSPIMDNPTAPAYDTFTVVNGFDGDITTRALPAAGSWWTWTMPAIPVTSSFKLHFSTNGSVGLNYCKINGQTIGALGSTTTSPFQLTADQWQTAFSKSTFDKLEIGYDSGSNYCYLHAIEIDGKMLVDTSEATSVSVVSTNTTDNKMVVKGGSWSVSALTQDFTSNTVGPVPQTGTYSYGWNGKIGNDINNEDYWQVTDASAAIQVTFDPPITFADKVEAYNADSCNFAVNATTGNNNSLPSGSTVVSANEWTELTATSPMSSLRIMGTPGGGMPNMSGLRVDGVVLVDAAPPTNSSAEWSDYGSGTTESGYGWDGAFDGKLTAGYPTAAAQGATATWTYSDGVDCSQGLAVAGGPSATGDESNTTFVINAGLSDETTVNFGDFTVVGGGQSLPWIDVAGVVTRLYSITLTSNTNYMYCGGVKCNGKVLVDTSEAPAEDTSMTKVEYQTDGGQGTVVEVDTDNNTITVDNTGTRDNRWIGANKAGTAFSVAGPSVTDNPLITSDITLVSSAFATTPANAGTFTNAKWAITNNTTNETETLDAGPITTYKPPAGTFDADTNYSVAVTYQSNTLSDSTPSGTVSFTTGGTNQIYSMLIDARNRLASLESDEINDDATDTALLTLLASLASRVAALENAS